MGSFDCVCVLCAGPLGIGHVRFGSAKGFALRKRREALEKEQQRRRGELVHVVRKSTGGRAPRKRRGDMMTATTSESETAVETGLACEDSGRQEREEWGCVEGDAVEGKGGEGEGEAKAKAADDEETAADIAEEEKQWEDISDEFDSDFEDDEYEYESSFSSSSCSSGSSSASASASLPELDITGPSNRPFVAIHDVPLRPATPVVEPDSDAWSEESDLSLSPDWTPYSSVEPSDDLYAYYERKSYDATVLDLEETRWLDRCRCLAMNGDAKATGGGGRGGKAFFSGRGRYGEYGTFNVCKRGRSRHDNGARWHSVYWDRTHRPTEENGFGLHEACFRILQRQLVEASGSQDRAAPYSRKRGHAVDQDVLYRVFHSLLSPMSGHALDLDYQLATPDAHHEQFWEPTPGTEYLVCDPGPQPSLCTFLYNALPPGIFALPPITTPTPTTCTTPPSNDPFSALPYDILFSLLLCHLPLDAILALSSASPHVARQVAGPTSRLWRALLRTRILPWFWELEAPLRALDAANEAGRTVPCKALFLWLEAVTRPRVGMRGALMGVANRRRVWSVVRPVARLYSRWREGEE